MIDVPLLVLANFVTAVLLFCMLQDEKAFKKSTHLFRAAVGFVAAASLAIAASPLWGYIDIPLAELAKHAALMLMVVLLRLKQCRPTWFEELAAYFDRVASPVRVKLRELRDRNKENHPAGKAVVAFLAVMFVVACWCSIPRAVAQPVAQPPVAGRT